MARILIVEDAAPLRASLCQRLEGAGHEVKEATEVPGTAELVRTSDVELILCDWNLGEHTAAELLAEIRADGFAGAIVVVTAYGTVETAVEAMQAGADDFVQKPVKLDELPVLVGKWLRQRRITQQLQLYQRMEQTHAGVSAPVGSSEAWLEAIRLARRFARVPVHEVTDLAGTLPTALITGETGTGKGVLARYIHDCACSDNEGESSKRLEPAPPFVHINCSALPTSLVESELFGHERGAFTDAREARPGLFELADGGTVFLDEIGDMPVELQAKLLVVVEQGRFRRIGGSQDRRVSARIIAASNQPLEDLVKERAFRADLFYRLNTLTICIPPLRDRGEDALEIARYTLESLQRTHQQRWSFTPDAENAIRTYEWPGNVRELLNTMQRVVMLCDGPDVTLPDLHLPQSDQFNTVTADRRHAAADDQLIFDFKAGAHTIGDVERQLIVQAIDHAEGNVTKAARIIGLTRAQIRHRIRQYGIK